MQRALARQRFAAIGLLAPVPTEGIPFTGEDRQQRILAQLLVVAEILVPEGDAVYPLPNELLDAVLHQPRIPEVGEARRQTPKNSSPALHLGQQQRAAVGTDRPAIEEGLNLAPAYTLKLEAPQ